jgi:acyl-CoA synthetase (AMP-forming)/AMP-acid ligase II
MVLATDLDLVHSGFLKVTADTPDKVALIADDEPYTYAELNARAHRFALYIEDLGAQRVALCLPNSPLVVDTFIGTLMAAGCVCLFDPGWPTPLVNTLMSDHRPDVIITPADAIGDFSKRPSQTSLLSSENVEAIVHQEVLSETLTSMATPETPFLLGFTSGSSGPPKGFIRPHLTWTKSFRHSALEFEMTAQDCVLAPGPLSHGLSLYAVLETLCGGATALIQSRFDAALAFSSIEQHDVTTVVLVPAMLDVLLEHANGKTFGGVRQIITAGAKLSPSLRQRTTHIFPNAETTEYYGASELSFVTVAKGADNCPPDSVGRAFSGVEIEIRDETGQAVRAGSVGTVWVKSGMLCSGYVGPTDGSGMRVEGLWATVGDFGHLDKEGYLFLDGREGSAITSAGYTVYPSAIEAALISHPDINDAAVIGLRHARWGEVIAAVVVQKDCASLSEAALVEYCRETLEPYACPRQWVIADELVRTQSGKIDRAALTALFDETDA